MSRFRGEVHIPYPPYSNQGDSPAAAVRAGDWKLIEHFEDGYDLELYNLKDDIGETTNLAQTEQAKCMELQARLIAWREEVEALIPKPNPNWVPIELPEGCDPAEV